MTELKREYVVPLRRKTSTAPKWRRSKKSVSVLKDFIRKHMKTEDVIVCSELNEFLWSRGAKNPPGKVSVVALKKEFSGEEKTLVNLQEAGIDKQVELYKVETQAAPQEAKAKEEVQEAEVKEVESKKEEEKVEEKKKDSADKKEVKKDE